MSILDRHLWRTLFGRWLLLIALGTVLLESAFVSAEIGSYLGAIGAGRLWWVLADLALALPEHAAHWLPFSAACAALLAAAQLRREGALIALASAGIAPARIFAPALGLGVLACGASYFIADQVLPRLADVRAEVEAALDGKGERNLRQVSWREGDWRWQSTSANPSAGVYHNLVGIDPVGRRVLLVARASWQDDRWHLHRVTALGIPQEGITGDRRVLAEATPEALTAGFGPDRRRLAVRLRPDEDKTTHELLRAPPRIDVLALRWAWTVLPLLCLLLALPGFVRNERGGGAGVWVAAGVRMLVPLALVGLLARVLRGSALDPLLVALALLLPVAAWGAVAWVRMRI